VMFSVPRLGVGAGVAALLHVAAAAVVEGPLPSRLRSYGTSFRWRG
jgi:hypothetical protein